MKYKFICPLIRCQVILLMGDRKLLKEYDPDDKRDCFGALCKEVEYESGEIGYLVWVQGPSEYNTMVHETIHLVQRIFKNTKIPFTAENEEIIAYYQNYWVRKFWHVMGNFIEKEKKGKNNGSTKRSATKRTKDLDLSRP